MAKATIITQVYRGPQGPSGITASELITAVNDAQLAEVNAASSASSAAASLSQIQSFQNVFNDYFPSGGAVIPAGVTFFHGGNQFENISDEDLVTPSDMSEENILDISGFVKCTCSSGSSNPPPSTTGTISAVEILSDTEFNGWVAKVTLSDWTVGGTYNFDLNGTPNFVLNVTRPAFGDTGATTRTSEVYATKVVREVHPSFTLKRETQVGSDVEVLVSLSEQIYSGDTLTLTTSADWATNTAATNGSQSVANVNSAVTNNSSYAYRQPWSVKFADVPYRLLGANDSVEVVIDAPHGQDMRPVYEVEFIFTGQTSGHIETSKVRQLVVSTAYADPNKVQVFRPNIDYASFTQGEEISARAIARPFIGDANAVVDTNDYAADYIKRPGNHTFICNKDGTYERPLYFVDPTLTDSTGAVVSTDEATARANPFHTPYAGAVAVQSFNGRGNIGGAIGYLMEGTHNEFGGAISNLTNGGTWFTLERDPNAAVGSVILGGTATNDDFSDKLCLRNIRCLPQAGNPILIDGPDNSSITADLWLDNVDFDFNNVADSIIYQVGFIYMTGGTYTNVGNNLGNFSTSVDNIVLARGCTISGAGLGSRLQAHCIIGNELNNMKVGEHATSTANQIYPDGQFIGFNKFNNCKGTAIQVGEQDDNVIGRAIICNVIEDTSNGVQPIVRISGDGNLFPFNGAGEKYNTVPSGRVNSNYNDEGTAAVYKTFMDSAFNIYPAWNNKRDSFNHPTDGYNGGRNGNWAVSHHVGSRGNVILFGSSNGDLGASPESWLGDALGKGTIVGSAVNFTNDLSGNGGAGNGDYTLQAGSNAINKVPAGLACLAFDIAGNPRRNDGTGAAGAYES